MSQPIVYPIPSCSECGIQSAGRCPTCHHSLCLDHFPLDEHQPCATRLIEHKQDYVCYVCGAPVHPQQWSTAVFAHYIDYQTCAGCKRYICDELHTRVRDEDVRIERDGLRSHRYHYTRRYCDACAPARRFGGLVGAGWLTAIVVVLVGALFLVTRFVLKLPY